MKLQRTSRIDLDKMGMGNTTEGRKGQKERGYGGQKQKIPSRSKRVWCSWKGSQEGFWSADKDTFLIWFYLYHHAHFIMSHKCVCDMHPFLYVKF